MNLVCTHRLARVAAAALLLAVVLSGCATSGSAPVEDRSADAQTPDSAGATPPDGVALPPANATPDYQLGGAYDPADGVGIVGRDRSDPPADGVYSICYVNGFQTQPGELEIWPEQALLHRDGTLLFDPDWPEEALLDTSSPERRSQILDLVRPWIVGCAEDGYDAVEFDNLDSYTRSHGALTLEDNLALATEFVAVAHEAGLAAGQKNAAEDTERLRARAGFDFAVTEECAAYRECDTYTSVYGPHVIDIEYSTGTGTSFSELCAQPDSPPSMVHRDRELGVPGDPGYVFETCDTAP